MNRGLEPMPWWSNLLDSGLSSDETEPTQLERIRLTNVALLIMIVVALPFAVQYTLLDLPMMTAAVLGTAVVGLVTLWRLRSTHDSDRAGLIVGMTLMALLLLSNVTSGGFYDPNFGWLYIVPLVGALLATPRAVWLFGGLVLLATLVFWALPQLGVPIESRVPADARAVQSLFNRLSAVGAIAVLVAAIVARHHRNRRRMERMAHYDALTGLPNRRLLEYSLGDYQARMTGASHGVAVLLIDLDRFKTINDTLGHHGGDDLLREVARRIVHSTPDAPQGQHVVARFGGDEFVVAFETVPDDAWACRVAQRLVDGLQAPFLVGEYELFPGASAGVAVGSRGESWPDLLRRADIALHEAKRRGGGCLVQSTATLIAAEERRLHLESRLPRALERDEFSLAFQPLVRADGGEIIACEALLRWQLEGAAVPPCDFIPIAEQTGDILEIGRFVLRRACAQLARWREQGLPDIRMSVNISARQLQTEGMVATVADVLRDNELCASRLELELTESVLMDASEVAQRSITELVQMGVALALDDFGTGYSALSYLSRFPFRTLKIDRSFVVAAAEGGQDAKLVGAIATLGQRLSLRVVAEGVETIEQAHMLRSLGCDELQGYYFGRPMTAEAFSECLAKGLTAKAERAANVG